MQGALRGGLAHSRYLIILSDASFFNAVKKKNCYSHFKDEEAKAH